MSKKAVLIILDGYGIAPATPGNAITTAQKPNLDKLFSENPYTQLQASGLEVGLPKGQMGNSEVGHTNIGAGRVVFQILPKISQEIENGKFFQNPVYIKAMDDAKNGGHALHVMGFSPPAACTATCTTSLRRSIWLSSAALGRSMSIASSTGATSRPRAARALSRSFRKSAMTRQRQDRHSSGTLLGHGS